MKTYVAVLAVVVLAGGVMLASVAPVLADSEGAGFYGTTNPEEWTNFETSAPSPKTSVDRSVAAKTDSWLAQGPSETGSLPGLRTKAEGGRWVNMDPATQNFSPELRGLPNIQAGP